MRPALALMIASLGLGMAAAHAQPAQPDVSRPCAAAPGTPGCPAGAKPGNTPDTSTRAPGSVEMQTSPTGMMTDSAKQPSPPDPKPKR